MTEYNLEEFFLRGITRNQKITVKKSLDGTMRGFLLAIALVWIGFHFFAHVADNEFNVFLLNILFFPLIPIVILLSKKAIAFGLNKYINNSKKQESKFSHIKIASFSGAALGLIFARFLFSQLNIELIEIILIFIILFMLLIMLHCAVITFYKIKLIKQYCPDLLDRVI